MRRSTLTVPEALLASVFGLATLGQFERWLTPLGRVSWHEIGLVFFTIYTMTRANRRLIVDQIRKRKWLFISTGVFLLWTLGVTALNAYWLDTLLLLKVGGAYLARWTLYLVFGASLWLAVKTRLIRSRWLYLVALGWLLLMALLGIGQYLFFPDARMLVELGWDDHLNRAFGTLLDPGFFGLLMAIGSIWLLGIWRPIKKHHFDWQAMFFGILLLALSLSFSRASYLAFVVGVLVLAWIKRSRRTLLFIPLLIMAIVLVPKDGGGEGQNLARTNSIASRVEVAEFHAEGLTLQEAILGRGWYYESVRQLHIAGVEAESGGQAGETGLPQHAQAVDNSYLHIFLSTGVVGAVLFGTSLIIYLRRLGRNPNLAVITVLLVHSLFSSGLFYSWALLALVVVVESAYVEK